MVVSVAPRQKRQTERSLRVPLQCVRRKVAQGTPTIPRLGKLRPLWPPLLSAGRFPASPVDRRSRTPTSLNTSRMLHERRLQQVLFAPSMRRSRVYTIRTLLRNAQLGPPTPTLARCRMAPRFPPLRCPILTRHPGTLLASRASIPTTASRSLLRVMRMRLLQQATIVWEDRSSLLLPLCTPPMLLHHRYWAQTILLGVHPLGYP